VNRKYSAHIYEPLSDRSLALIFSEEYQIRDHKVFNMKKEAENYSSIYKEEEFFDDLDFSKGREMVAYTSGIH